MFWKGLWFGVNTLFVIAIIVTMFMHRAVAMGKLQGVEASREKTLILRRNWMVVISIILFIAMSTAFVLNMKMNG